MTTFLDVRLANVGGALAPSVALNGGTSIGDYTGITAGQLAALVQGRHVLIATHGFNVNRADGIAALANWDKLLRLPAPSVFLGLLWPGDSTWAHGLEYPTEPRIANEAAQVVAPFIDAACANSASVSLASHSLGARVVLETVQLMTTPVRRVTLMAGAIDDDCLNNEFKQAVAKIGQIAVLASRKDDVLAAAFPIGNFFAGIIAAGHPWWRGALGRGGPVSPTPANFRAPFELPDAWGFGHGDYLRVAPAPPAPIAVPQDVPPAGAASLEPGDSWKPVWSAAFESTRFA